MPPNFAPIPDSFPAPYAPNWSACTTSSGAQIKSAVSEESHPAFLRMLERLPYDVRQSLTVEQLVALAHASKPSEAPHLIAYRTSLPFFFGRRYYVSLLFGRERRALARLMADGHASRRRTMLTYAVALLTLVLFVMAGFYLAIILLDAALRLDAIAPPAGLEQFGR